MKIEEFKKRKKPKNKSKLFDFKIEIMELIRDEYSQESICEFLKENGVKSKQSNISKNLKKKKKLQKPKEETPKIEEKKSNISINEMKQLKEEKSQEPAQKKSLLKTSNVKKFEIIEPDYSQFIH